MSCNDDVLSEDTPFDYALDYVEISDVDEVNGIAGSEVMQFKDAPSRARRLVRDGDIILSTVRTYLRAIAAIASPPDNLVVSTGFAVLRPRHINSKYARYAVAYDGFIQEVISRSKGISYPAINASELVRIALPVPPADEQQAISDYLETETARIDALIREKVGLIELLGEYRQSVATDAVVRGLNPNCPMTQIDGGFKSIPTHWEMICLKRFVRVVGGHTPSTENPRYWNGDIPWVSPKDMKRDELSDSIDHVTHAAVSDCGLAVLEAGATLVVVRGMILAHSFPVARNMVPVTINQDMKAIRPVEKVLPEYLPWLLRGVKSVILSLTEQSAHGTLALRTDKFFGEALPIPPIEEQSTIVDYLNVELPRIDELVAHASKEVKLLKELRAATIADAVLGRIDVRQTSRQ
jgi:type I restriction enzyme S subunit